MAVFRIEKTRDYTLMSNHHLRNTALSLKAQGLLSFMLSLYLSNTKTADFATFGAQKNATETIGFHDIFKSI